MLIRPASLAQTQSTDSAVAQAATVPVIASVPSATSAVSSPPTAAAPSVQVVGSTSQAAQQPSVASAASPPAQLPATSATRARGARTMRFIGSGLWIESTVGAGPPQHLRKKLITPRFRIPDPFQNIKSPSPFLVPLAGSAHHRLGIRSHPNPETPGVTRRLTTTTDPIVNRTRRIDASCTFPSSLPSNPAILELGLVLGPLMVPSFKSEITGNVFLFAALSSCKPTIESPSPSSSHPAHHRARSPPGAK
ncbi:hypothetical protein BDK51DRAFT_47618 [Blyttiomyces helicus]|uniref:Uncharacterized protein n=1 Tax=Blyttiomyces helicus TaxID=388810 RepID=A0A4P9W5H0_9FUNG|nr:hypothetical protein BDK51DRAFT_47618 [Blyttiomyces helicus]|eukprot:RKO85346.1 hypothetical protein BDK51DRAFT_47618 [Blyttiomyces helicus]